MSGQELRLSAAELSPLMQACLDDGGEIMLTVTGNSMAPFLRHERDTVVLVKPADATALQVGDVPLYRRQSGRLVLHRIVARQEQPVLYTMCGDAQTQREDGISPAQVMAVACAFVRKGKRYACTDVAYRRYVARWSFWRGLRRPLLWLYYLPERGKRVLHKLKEHL